ncbi:cytochrome oxidase putative small subunit CydP [Janthinobacterium sp. B9-8]|uniref:cytochrome oxidase putative small subunit CydP n=1 Tax=Janthinobacterium sp. B9-8 TaxID=1236179 RepID=UPI00061D251B|nr:cytochrome oxidase putative small subunit CydP [Janthinobacterium sp. B9-8]AMC34942.1 hypothetical protein VN23_10130 [Janthinobacterium sp. B9-8]
MRIAKHIPLWQEITIVLLIKVALLFVIWKSFFSEPVARHMLVPEPMIAERFMNAASAPASLYKDDL